MFIVLVGDMVIMMMIITVTMMVMMMMKTGREITLRV